MTRARFDAIVVGGGPAGSTCAWQLERAGLEVAVLDKADFPRDKVCAGWVTPAVLESLELDAKDYRRGRVFQPIRAFRTGRLGRPLVRTDYPEPVSYGIRRHEFDHYLLARSGAALRTGQAVRTIERRRSRWIVNGDVEAPILIGAGGHFCPVARHLGAKLGASETIVAAHEIEFEMNEPQARECAVEMDTPELFFCPDLKGYGWIFRKENVLNIGLGREDNRNLAREVEAFRARLVEEGRIPPALPGRFKGHAYLLYDHSTRPCLGDGALLVGDAIGLAYTQSGEGIRPAVESALLAARAIVDAGGDYRRERLAPYRQQLEARYGRRRRAAARSSWMPEGLRRGFAGALLANPWFTRHVVLNRWFLHVRQPGLGAST